MSNSSVVISTTGDKLQTYENDLGSGPVHSEAVTPTDPDGIAYGETNPQYVVSKAGVPSQSNNSTDLPTTGSPFVGEWELYDEKTHVQVTMNTDVNATVFFQFYEQTGGTPNAGTTPHSSVSRDFLLAANRPFYDVINKGPRWYRTRVEVETNPSTFRVNTNFIDDLSSVLPNGTPLYTYDGSLDADEVIESEWFDAFNYSGLAILTNVDTLGGSNDDGINALEIIFSIDQSAEDRVLGIDVLTAGSDGGDPAIVPAEGRWVMFRYTNGSSSASSVRLGIAGVRRSLTPKYVALEDTITGRSLATLSRSVLTGEADDGSGDLKNVSVHADDIGTSIAVGQGHRISEMFGRSPVKISNGATAVTSSSLLYTVPEGKRLQIHSITATIANSSTMAAGRALIRNATTANTGDVIFPLAVNQTSVTAGAVSPAVNAFNSYPEPIPVTSGLYINIVTGSLTLDFVIVGYLEDT